MLTVKESNGFWHCLGREGKNGLQKIALAELFISFERIYITAWERCHNKSQNGPSFLDSSSVMAERGPEIMSKCLKHPKRTARKETKKKGIVQTERIMIHSFLFHINRKLLKAKRFLPVQPLDFRG